MVQAQSQLGQVKFHILLREHNLQEAGEGCRWDRFSLRSWGTGQSAASQSSFEIPVPYTLLCMKGSEE